MVQFVEDDDPKTTGNGKFLSSLDGNINYWNQSEARCEGFLVDPPPHNKQYFEHQIEAVKNYYLNISNNQINFTYDVLDPIYQLEMSMIEYSEISSYDEPNESIAQLFSDALTQANNDIDTYLENNDLNEEDILIVVFHAGVGEDYGFDGYVDPANYDIRSAYIDSEITSFFPDHITISKGILLPETLNLIYYPTIEDIYGYQGQGLCEIQVGMTGLFAYLLGYEFGLSEMFDRNTGKTGLGVFELMDIGSFNGRGTIPAPPQAWSRIQMDWEESALLQEESISYISNKIRFSDEENTSPTVHRINMTEDEYYLLESVDNNIIEGEDRSYDISEISYMDTISAIHIPDSEISIFDRLVYLDDSITDIIDYSDECSDDAKLTISSTTNVVLCAKNYDYGLPGEGMMVWHVNESNINNLNDDIENRTVKLIEADGAQDIGYQNYFYPFADPSVGWMWDLWFEENEAYFSVNTTENDVNLNSYTMPSTHTDNGSTSLIEITDIKKSTSYSSMLFKFDYEDDTFTQYFISNSTDILCVGVSPHDSDILFFDTGEELCMYHLDEYYPENELLCDIDIDGYETGNFIYLSGILITCSIDEYYDTNQNVCISLDGYIPRGYFSSSNALEDIPEQFRDIHLSRLALGDIDQDGFDEIIERTDNYITCYNANGSICNGFPVLGSYHGNIVIGNLVGDEDEYPEIIVRSDGVINFISHNGELDYQISSQSLSNLYLVDDKQRPDSVTLLDGNRILSSNYGSGFSGNIYWGGPNGGYNNQPDVSGSHELPNYSAESKISVFYNYPNPTKDDKTTFRYFISESEKAEIKIYSSSGFLVKDISNLSFIENEYNEVLWDVSDQPPGLYLANLIIYDNGKQSDSKFAKVLVGNK